MANTNSHSNTHYCH